MRESTQSWREGVARLRARGRHRAASEFASSGWRTEVLGRAQRDIPGDVPQRRWAHKTANVLNYLSRAVTCLAKDREALLLFYDYPAEHWVPFPAHDQP